MRTKTVNIYNFDELSDSAQEKAIENIRNRNYENNDFSERTLDDNYLFEPKHAILEGLFGDKYKGDPPILGNSRKVYFSLDRDRYLDATKGIEVNDEHAFLQWLGIPLDLQPHVYWNITNSGNDTIIEFELGDWDENKEEFTDAEEEILEDAQEKFSDHMSDVLQSIEDNIDYLFSDEAIKEDIEANEYEFTEEGEITHSNGGSAYAGGGELSDRQKSFLATQKRRFNSDLNNPKRKTVDIIYVQGNYGSGWEDLTAHETKVEAMIDKRAYDENEAYPHRLKTKKVNKSDYNSGNYSKGGSTHADGGDLEHAHSEALKRSQKHDGNYYHINKSGYTDSGVKYLIEKWYDGDNTIATYFKGEKIAQYSGGGKLDVGAREKHNKLVGRKDSEFYFVDDIFKHGDDFMGATGTGVAPVSKEYHEYATSREGLAERFVDAMSQEEWLGVIGRDEDEFDSEEELEKAIIDSIVDQHRYGQLDPFEEAYDEEEQMRAIGFSEDEYPIFEVVSGGRIFSKDMKFDEVYDQELLDRILLAEDGKLSKGGSTYAGGGDITDYTNGEVVNVADGGYGEIVYLDDDEDKVSIKHQDDFYKGVIREYDVSEISKKGGSTYTGGGEIRMEEGKRIYALANSLTKDQEERLKKTLNEKELETFKILVQLGDTSKVALITTLVDESPQHRLKWLQNQNGSTYAEGGEIKDWVVRIPFGVKGAGLFDAYSDYYVRTKDEDEAKDKALLEFYEEYDADDYEIQERKIDVTHNKSGSTYAEGGELGKFKKKEVFEDTFEFTDDKLYHTFLVHKKGKNLSTSVTKPNGQNVRIIKGSWKDLEKSIRDSKGTPAKFKTPTYAEGGETEGEFKIDLSKYNLDRDDYSNIEKYAIKELTKKTGIEKLSVDHFYDMGDYGGDENLHVLEISYPTDDDDEFVNTYIFKEEGNLIFNVKADTYAGGGEIPKSFKGKTVQSVRADKSGRYWVVFFEGEEEMLQFAKNPRNDEVVATYWGEKTNGGRTVVDDLDKTKTYAGGGEIGDEVVVITNMIGSKEIKGKIESLSPFKIRTDDNSVRVIPNRAIIEVKSTYAEGGEIHFYDKNGKPLKKGDKVVIADDWVVKDSTAKSNNGIIHSFESEDNNRFVKVKLSNGRIVTFNDQETIKLYSKGGSTYAGGGSAEYKKGQEFSDSDGKFVLEEIYDKKEGIWTAKRYSKNGRYVGTTNVSEWKLDKITSDSGGEVKHTLEDFNKDHDAFTDYVFNVITLDQRRQIRKDWNNQYNTGEKDWHKFLLTRVNEIANENGNMKRESYKGGGAVDNKIALFQKMLDDPRSTTDEKERYQKAIDKLKGSAKPAEKKEDKKADKKPMVRKPAVKKKPVAKKPAEKKEDKKPAPKKPAEKKEEKKPAKKGVKVLSSKRVSVDGQEMEMDSKEFCDYLLSSFNKRREKAKAQKGTKKKTTSVMSRVSDNIEKGVTQAIKSGIKENKDSILKNPKPFIGKVQKLETSTKNFLNDLKDVLGKEFDAKEITDTTKAIEELISDLKKKVAGAKTK